MLTFSLPLVKVTVPASGTTGVVAFPCFTMAGSPAPGRGQAGAPAAPGRSTRARTNELEAGKRRPMIGSEEQPPAIGVCGDRWPGFPVRANHGSGRLRIQLELVSACNLCEQASLTTTD